MEKISLSPRQRGQKLATRALIEAVGGFEVAAVYCRLRKSQLHRCCDFNAPDFLPIDVVSDLETVAGATPITTLHARQNGGVVVRIPAADVAHADLYAGLAAASREHGAITTSLLEALGDGVCTPAEAASLLPKATKDIEAGVRLRALLEQIADAA